MTNPLYRNEAQGQLPDSWYLASCPLPALRPALTSDISVDVAIVGAGFTGLSAARHLAEKGMSVTVLEAHRVGFGASGRNGGQVCSGYNVAQADLAAYYGAEHARRLWTLSEEAKADVRSFCASHVPEALFRPGIAEAAARPAEVPQMHRDARFLQESYGYDQITPLDREAIRALIRTDDYYGGHLDMGAGHIHPLRYVLALARAAEAAGAVIHDQTEVTKIIQGDPARLITPAGTVTAAHVILAGNGYLPRLIPEVSAKILPVNSFIAATEPLGDQAAQVLAQDIAVSDSKFVLSYFRLSEDKRLLYGGRPSYRIAFPKDLRTVMAARIGAMFPQIKGVKVDYAWGGTLGLTPRLLPSLERVGSNILSAAGYSGHGVALANLAGKILAEVIAGQAGRFDTFTALNIPGFPGGTRLRAPILRLAMTWYALRDRLGI